MKQFEANSHSMYLALQDFYPKVHPSMEFVSNLFRDFEKNTDPDSFLPWGSRLERWLPTNTGLIRDPVDVNWNTFRIVDERLYSFALLRYS